MTVEIHLLTLLEDNMIANAYRLQGYDERHRRTTASVEQHRPEPEGRKPSRSIHTCTKDSDTTLVNIIPQ